MLSWLHYVPMTLGIKRGWTCSIYNEEEKEGMERNIRKVRGALKSEIRRDMPIKWIYPSKPDGSGRFF